MLCKLFRETNDSTLIPHITRILTNIADDRVYSDDWDNDSFVFSILDNTPKPFKAAINSIWSRYGTSDPSCDSMYRLLKSMCICGPVDEQAFFHGLHELLEQKRHVTDILDVIQQYYCTSKHIAVVAKHINSLITPELLALCKKSECCEFVLEHMRYHAQVYKSNSKVFGEMFECSEMSLCAYALLYFVNVRPFQKKTIVKAINKMFVSDRPKHNYFLAARYPNTYCKRDASSLVSDISNHYHYGNNSFPSYLEDVMHEALAMQVQYFVKFEAQMESITKLFVNYETSSIVTRHEMGKALRIMEQRSKVKKFDKKIVTTRAFRSLHCFVPLFARLTMFCNVVFVF